MDYINLLNDKDVNVRLDALKQIKKQIDSGEIQKPEQTGYVNNHIHTIYSFSPYSPSKAVYMAYMAGLKTAGIMDHDSISGAEEFIKAGEIMGIATTIGVETRVDVSSTCLNGRRINNPDQKSIMYMALHGVPHTNINVVNAFFEPYRQKRNIRNQKMVDNINKLMAEYNICYDFEKDVASISQRNGGGSITERHILYALALKLVERFGKGEKLVSFLTDTMKLDVSAKIKGFLSDNANPYYEYDLLGVLKSSLVERFYVDATDECPSVQELVALSNKVGSISAYAYLGDVGDSVTGDKKAQKFEDDYIVELFDALQELGFNAVTYMPSRNSIDQLKRVKSLCDERGFFQISGEDINTPRQSFICKALDNPEFANLVDATWALIGHEKAATKCLDDGMFTQKTKNAYPDMNERIRHFKNIGLNL